MGRARGCCAHTPEGRRGSGGVASVAPPRPAPDGAGEPLTTAADTQPGVGHCSPPTARLCGPPPHLRPSGGSGSGSRRGSAGRHRARLRRRRRLRAAVLTQTRGSAYFRDVLIATWMAGREVLVRSLAQSRLLENLKLPFSLKLPYLNVIITVIMYIQITC